MRLVWDESFRQASEMLAWWKMQGSTGVSSTARNSSTLTLHVLSSAGFGKSYPFQGSTEAMKEASPMNHRDALSMILGNTMVILIVMATLFRKYRVQPVLQPGELMDQSLKRIMKQMLHPQKA